MTRTFNGWTEYDNWLIQNYDKFAITSLNEEQGKISAEYMDKSEWEAERKKAEDEEAKKSSE